MDHVLAGRLSGDEIIFEGYSREKILAKITTDITARELNMLELALHRLWIDQVDNDGKAVNCEQSNADATYYLWKRVELWKKELKLSAERLYYDNFAEEIVTKREPAAPPERYVELSRPIVKAVLDYMENKNDE